MRTLDLSDFELGRLDLIADVLERGGGHVSDVRLGPSDKLLLSRTLKAVVTDAELVNFAIGGAAPALDASPAKRFADLF